MPLERLNLYYSKNNKNLNLMDLKKSSKATLEDKKFFNILMGLVVVLAVLYIGFEWTNKEMVVYDEFASRVEVEEEIEIIQATQELPPPPPPPAPDIVEEINVVEDDVVVEEIQINTEDDNKRDIVINQPVSAGTGVSEDPTDSDVPFHIVEKMPSFPGGESALNQYLNKNIKYPPIALENGVSGRVICQFVVNRDGSIVDIEVVRSVDKSLDNEAIRVIKSMPKWTPGEQRGKPVRVKYTLPVNFRIQ